MRCLKPIILKNGETPPCGRCYNCRYNRAAQWSFRLQQEERVSSHALFVTFTYDGDHIVYAAKSRRPTLVKKDMVDYMKRLRKLTTRAKRDLRYYVVGEYGGQTKRPHYHAIIFNATEQEIHDAWMLKRISIGGIFCGDVNANSIGYTLKYMMKDYRKSWKDDREKTFSLMSKGLGENGCLPKLSIGIDPTLVASMLH